MQPVAWSLAGVWNKSFDLLPPKSSTPRNYIYASELGGSFFDRFHKMKGTAPSNPPTGRSERKFEAGNSLESTLKDVFGRLGVLKEHHEKVRLTMDGCLMVSGEIDFRLGGGEIDFEKAEFFINNMITTARFRERCVIMLDAMKSAYTGVILQEYIHELKSCSAFAFDARERAGRGYDTHELQLYHYVISKNLPGMLDYVCKDDMRIQSFPILPEDGVLAVRYKNDIEEMTRYYLNDIEPPKEDPILFDADGCSFSVNKKIEWSPYLTMGYGFETPESFRDKYTSQVNKMNRVYKRCVNGDNMTKLNLEVIADAKKIFPDWDELVQIGQIAGIDASETDED